ncbi:hypothetical protein GCM10022286_30810 [Gryllotalpicola daejeonensis]|uniref:Uncharacterized protein n=1 Tax=Gryllotalpicola daejeonensis TaxID=993087 RepID=A0ABP7ZPA6_9MICO
MFEGQAAQDSGGLELTQTGREDVRRHPELALQIAVALRPVEQPLRDKQRPSCADDLEGCAETARAGVVTPLVDTGPVTRAVAAAHAVAAAASAGTSGFIQNGE